MDIGCGKHKRADVGIDVSRDSQADVIVDAQYLPFQDTIFDTVLSQHMIEHLQKPELAVYEMVRVSKAKVEIICPHRFGHYAKITSDHIRFYNKRWFTQLARKLNVKENVRTTFTPTFFSVFWVCLCVHLN
jgi:ubiquinone/menaquinone biosynthesis C-methylase UbiE